MTDSSKFGISVTYHYRKQRHEIVVSSLKICSPPENSIILTKIAQKGSNQLIQKVSKRFDNIILGSKSSGSIILDHFFPYYEPPTHVTRSLVRKAQKSRPRYVDLTDTLWLFNRVLMDHLRGVEFIGPFRRGPERVYTFSGETPSSVGVHGEKSIDIIVADHFRRMSKRLNISEKISSWLRTSQIANALEVVPLTDRHFELRLSHFGVGWI